VLTNYYISDLFRISLLIACVCIDSILCKYWQRASSQQKKRNRWHFFCSYILVSRCANISSTCCLSIQLRPPLQFDIESGFVLVSNDDD